MAKKILFLIILLGFTLRIWQIDRFPGLLYGDEQSFAWNAYNILKLGKDEYGTPYPLQFRAFNDYKAPIPIYLLLPFIKVFGLNNFAIRLPIVLASTITIAVVYLLSRLFFNVKASLLITFLMAISPWHIHLSRGFFESTLALLWFVLGVYFFIKDRPNLKLTLVSMFFFALAVYTYFTPRILIPIFLVFLMCFQFYRGTWRELGLFKTIKIYAVSLVFLFIICLPMLWVTFFGPGLSRMSKLNESTAAVITETVKKERYATNLPSDWSRFFHNKATVWLQITKDYYLEQLSFNFWYIYGDSSLRYFTGNMGMFYLIEMPFLVIGLYSLWKKKKEAAIFCLGWILFAPIPAALAGKPFAVRNLALLPAPFLIVGFGLYEAEKFISNSKIRTFFGIFITVLFMASMTLLLIRYYLEYPVYAATWWGWENKAALDFAKAREDNFKNIFISDFYTGSTLAYAVYSRYDPQAYSHAITHPVTLVDGRHLIKLGKYYFGSLDVDKKRLDAGVIPPHSLYIGRPEEADSGEVIKAPDDGRILFKIYEIQ